MYPKMKTLAQNTNEYQGCDLCFNINAREYGKQGTGRADLGPGVGLSSYQVSG